MKNPVFLFLVIFSNFFSAQSYNYRAVYELKYRQDSTNRTAVKTENFVLDWGNAQSAFRSENKIIWDSVSTKYKDMQGSEVNFAILMATMSKLPKTNFRETILKNFPSGKVEYFGNVVISKLSYAETIDFKWKILDEKKKIGEAECQKATTTFGGRNWIAWFAQSVSIPDGPYKFHGLPGLIFEIYDEKDDYHYSLLTLKKHESAAPIFEKYVATTKQKFYKAYEDFRANPEAIQNQQAASMGINIISSTHKPNYWKEKWAKINNPIELKP